MSRPDEIEAALTALEMLHRAHHELAGRVARLLVRAQHKPADAPEWILIDQLTAKMEAINAMIEVCPDPAFSEPPPTNAVH